MCAGSASVSPAVCTVYREFPCFCQGCQSFRGIDDTSQQKAKARVLSCVSHIAIQKDSLSCGSRMNIASLSAGLNIPANSICKFRKPFHLVCPRANAGACSHSSILQIHFAGQCTVRVTQSYQRQKSFHRHTLMKVEVPAHNDNAVVARRALYRALPCSAFVSVKHLA